MNNYAIKNFYDKLVDLINNCGLPIGTAYFIVKNVCNELENGFYEAAAAERNQKPEEHSQTVNMPLTKVEEEEDKGD